jgi:uncharacterized protein (TIGR02466 family)
MLINISMITVQNIPIFVTAIAKAMVYNFEKASLINHILHLEKTTQSSSRSNAGGWQSFHYDHTKYDNPYAAELMTDNILPVLDQIAESWGFPKTKNLSYWYNVNRRYNYNHSHYHPQALLSGVIYLKVPTMSGRISFTRAASEADRMSFITAYQLESNNLCPDNPNINVGQWEVPQENLMIIFPGHLEHHVEQNQCPDPDDVRISISFNYFL